MTIWLALLIGCGVVSCSQHYEVFDNQSKCDVRLAEWNSSESVFNRRGRSGFCWRRDHLTAEEVETYRAVQEQKQ